MPSLDIGVRSPAGPLAFSKTISGPDLNRFAAAMRANYGQVDDGAGGLRDMTDEETFTRWAEGIYSSMIRTTRQTETSSAMQTAEDGVIDIVLT